MRVRVRASVHRFKGSGVKRLHSRPLTTFGMHTYDISVSSVSSIPKFGVKFAIIGNNVFLYEAFGS